MCAIHKVDLWRIKSRVAISRDWGEDRERQKGWAMDVLSLGVQCSGVHFHGDYR